MAPVPDLPPPNESTSARRRVFELGAAKGGGATGPIGIAGKSRGPGPLTPQVSELEAIRDRLLEDVEAMTARIGELERLAEGAAEEQRSRAAEEERERRERWTELERLAAARAERPALPRPGSEVVGPAPAAAAAVAAEPRAPARRPGRVTVAALAGLLLGAGAAAGVAAALDSGDAPSPARPAVAAAPRPPVERTPLCSETASDVDVTCDTGTRLFIAGEGSSADLGALKARVTRTELVGATAAIAVELTAARSQRLATDPERVYLSVGGRRYAATALDPIDLARGDKQTVTLQFLLDQPALDELAAKEGVADLGIVPPGARPGTRLGVLRVTLRAGG